MYCKRTLKLGLSVAAAVLAATLPAHAQTYPARPVRIVSVTSPGTGIDDYTRLLAKYLTEKSGQSFYVENRPGGNMIIATDAVAKSAPDGYTLLMATSTAIVGNTVLLKQLPYNPQRDFDPVARMTSLPSAIVVSASSQFRSVADLVGAAKAEPGKLNYGTSSGAYRASLAAFKLATKIDTVDVPYKAMTNLLPDLIAGTVDYTLLEVSAAVPMVQSGKLRALAVTGTRRLTQLPGVPALSELGLSQAPFTWSVLAAPKGTPPAILDKLQAWTLEFVNSPEALQHYAARGVQPNPGTRAEVSKAMVDELGNWKHMMALGAVQPQ